MNNKINNYVVLTNLTDAKEDLESLIKEVSDGADSIEMKVRLEHIVHHINWAWNGRFLPNGYDHTDELFKINSQSPSDLIPFGV